MTSSNTNILKKSVFNKPFLITTDDLSNIGQDINLVGYNNQLNLTSDDSNIILRYGNSSSPRLLNWVEPYTIAGVNYTLFYTEVNSGFKIGDKVFIINGSYDSNELISKNKYKKGHDGYKVIYIDNCKLVLDIEFDTNGNLPNSENSDYEDDFDKFIKIYTIKDSNEFLHVNRQITTQGPLLNRDVDYKFNIGYNNIVYTEIDFSAVTNEWGKNTGITGSPGFFMKDNLNWVNVTSQIMSGSYSNIITSDYSNDKLIILNGDFEYDYTEFKEDLVYNWDGEKWAINVKHENNNVAIITKSNFRKGTFDGIWNGGLYGSNEERIKWDSTSAIWNSGTLLNTVLEKGILNSLWSQKESYISQFDKYNNPYQKSTNPDNDGYGYNFIINSELKNAVINNGNVTNSILGVTNSISVVEEHVKGNYQLIIDSFNNTLVNKAFFDNCFFNNSNIENSIVKNSRVKNSRFFNVKSINTQYKNSLFKNSNYISDNIIKVLNYDIFKYNDGTSSSFTHYVYKLYINKKSYQGFKFKDTFYLKNVKVDNTIMLNFFDKKFKIGPWTEYTDEINNIDSNNVFFEKKDIEYNVFISTPSENEYIFDENNFTGLNENSNGYSIDIFIKSNEEILVDFTDAYILNSEFESGIFENSNWNSGNYINNNYDNNITNNGSYNLELNYNRILVNNIFNNNFKESEDDYLSDGSIVFLNMDYDTRGRVTDLAISEPGTGYFTQNGLSTNSNGGILIDIIADVIGAITYYTFEVEGLYNTNTTDIYTTSGGSGTGFEIEIESDVSGLLISSTIINSGYGYQIDDILTIDGTIGVIKITDINKGSIIDISIYSPGIGYKIGDILTIGVGNAKLIVLNTEGQLTKLPDTYKVSYENTMVLSEVVTNNSPEILTTLLPNGIFISHGANNRYGYIYPTKFNKSKIASGLFKRAYFKGSLIKNDSYDINDRDFINTDKLRSLVISESIFSGNSNILSKASYINSYFVGTTASNDFFDTGIVYNSIWNGLTFNNGIIKESTWIDGIFKNGIFFNSKNSNNSILGYNSNNINSFYKKNDVNDTKNNDRHSWQNGIFENGEFLKSDWEDGILNDGKFYYSKFYGGTINGGIIGDVSINTSDTKIYSGDINYTTVENAEITSDTTIGYGTHWYNGIFNNGIFTTSTNSTSIWYNGIFNGGDFKNKAKWKDGIFNGGKFYSTYGYNSLINDEDDIIDHYSWENGIFNGGQFGNKSTFENSTWFNGEFKNGYFVGKVWNNGVFLFGEFLGSGLSTIGGTSSPNIKGGLYSDVANDFVTSFAPFSNNYYGLWKNGFVTNNSKYLDKESYSDIRRSTDLSKKNTYALFKNVLWMSGTFSHPNAIMENSVWLDGTFENGTFDKSSFNPYVSRYENNIFSKKFNISDSIIWKDGTLKNSDFYISEWEKGNFISGTAIGMVWKNGVANYMNAYNVFWEDGLWRNGNWEGSYFDLESDGSVTDDYTRQILLRGMSLTSKTSCHVWNLFYKDSLTKNIEEISDASSVSWNVDNNMNQPPTAPILFEVGLLNIEIVLISVINNGSNFQVEFTTTFDNNDVFYEISSDEINWSSLNPLATNNEFHTSLNIFYIRLNSDNYTSNTIYYNNTLIVNMLANIVLDVNKTELEMLDTSTSYDVLTESILFEGYSNKNIAAYNKIRMLSLPSIGSLTLQGTEVITLPFECYLYDIENSELKFYPLGINNDIAFNDYTTSFEYIVIDSNDDESNNIQMQINFITN